MDTITGALLSGLAVNGLTYLAKSSPLLAPIRDSIAGSPITDDPRIDIEAHDLTMAMLAEFNELGMSSDVTRLATFARSVEAQAFTRELLVAQLTGRYRELKPDLKHQLVALLALRGGLSQPSAEALAPRFYEVIAKLCTTVTKKLLSRGENRAVFQFAWTHVVAAHLRNVGEATGLARTLTTEMLGQIYSYDMLYRELVHDRFSTIVPPNLDTRNRVPIDSLYVYPQFRMMDSSAQDYPDVDRRAFSYQALKADRLHRAIILGDPGAGKSTLAAKLAYDFSAPESAFDSMRFTPFVVILRDFAPLRQTAQQSIVDYLKSHSGTSLQEKPPSGAIEYLLLHGRALVIFDGLDELLETSFRRTLVEELESFAVRYPQAPMIITSRKVGYEEAQLNPQIFSAFELLELSFEAVEEYVNKAFRYEGIPEAQRERLVHSFMEESEDIAELRSNPLMLGLLCNIYSGEGYIPRNRPEVYDKCATMLFHRWDVSRGIRSGLPFEAHIDYAIRYLAFWIYSSQGLRAGVTESQLVAKTAEYLHGKRFSDYAEAEQAAQSFIGFCRGRAWVFSDTGSTYQELLFQFTHQTFLEYFSASHLVRSCSGPRELWGALKDHIESQEWDVVAQLAVQMQDRNLEEAFDRFITAALSEYDTPPKNDGEALAERNVLSFLSRCLHFMVPSPTSTASIAASVVRYCVRPGPSQFASARPADGRTISLLVDLLTVAEENLPTVTNALLEHCLGAAIADPTELRSAGLNLAANLDLILDATPMAAEARRRHWIKASAAFLDQNMDLFRQGSERLLDLGLALARRQKQTFKELATAHGIHTAFLPLGVIRGEGRELVVPSVAERLLVGLSAGLAVLEKDYRRDVEIIASQFESASGQMYRLRIARKLLDGSGYGSRSLIYYRRIYVGRQSDEYTSLSRHIAGAAFLFLAVAFELSNDATPWTSQSMFNRGNLGDAHYLADIFAVRAGKADQTAQAISNLENSSLGEADIEAITGWMSGRLSFLEDQKQPRRRRGASAN